MTDAIIAIIADIMDMDPTAITQATYLVRDLGAESIDLLEIGVAMEHRLGIPVQDDALFLRDLRLVLRLAEETNTPAATALASRYPHLTSARIHAILEDLANGPVLQVADLVAYATFHRPS